MYSIHFRGVKTVFLNLDLHFQLRQKATIPTWMLLALSHFFHCLFLCFSKIAILHLQNFNSHFMVSVSVSTCFSLSSVFFGRLVSMLRRFLQCIFFSSGELQNGVSVCDSILSSSTLINTERTPDNSKIQHHQHGMLLRIHFVSCEHFIAHIAHYLFR